MNESDILLQDRDADGILRLTLNDAARRNALSEAMLAALGDGDRRGRRRTPPRASSCWPPRGRPSAPGTI